MATSAIQRRKIELLLEDVERLPTLPGVAQHALRLAMADRPNLRSIQQTLESDAALAARTVALAIETAGPGFEPTSLEEALKAVPLESLTGDLLTTPVVDQQALRHGRFKAQWEHNLAVAMAAQIVAQRVGTVDPETAHLSGLIHDLGLSVLPILMPRAFREVLHRLDDGGEDPLQVERDVLGVDHVIVGKRLAQKWGFPESLQNVIWLHHQTHFSLPSQNGSGPLVQVVHLADLITRQQGYTCYPSAQVTGDIDEVARVVGLTPTAAEQIGQQVSQAFNLNADPVGAADEPTPGQLWSLVAEANTRLGSLFHQTTDRRRKLEKQTRRADVLVSLNSRLAACRTTREVLETVAETARAALDLRTVVPYVLGTDFAYIEGILAEPPDGAGDHFIVDVSSNQSLETLLADGTSAYGDYGTPLRAERVESWLFERKGEKLGPGPFYTVPMVIEGSKVGGLVFSVPSGTDELMPREVGELAALAAMAALAVKRAQAEADLMNLSEELAEVNRELRQAEEQRVQQRSVAGLSEMAAGAAHEINNPLAVISGRAQRLASGEEDPQRQEMLQSIIRQSARISDIISELHRFARPSTPERGAVDPVSLAEEVANEIRHELDADTEISIDVEAPSRVPAIFVDRRQVREALVETLHNAVEALGDAGRVSVMVQPLADKGRVRILVIDNGPGMEPQDRSRAFDPFFSIREAGRHRGLGLPRAYRAVQANGGQMALESAPDEGTRVRMTFPAAETGPNSKNE